MESSIPLFLHAWNRSMHKLAIASRRVVHGRSVIVKHTAYMSVCPGDLFLHVPGGITGPAGLFTVHPGSGRENKGINQFT